MNINKFVDKKFEKMTFKQLKDAPVHALSGVSERDAGLLKQTFKKRELSKYVNIARAIVELAKAEE